MALYRLATLNRARSQAGDPTPPPRSVPSSNPGRVTCHREGSGSGRLQLVLKTRFTIAGRILQHWALRTSQPDRPERVMADAGDTKRTIYVLS